MTQKQFDQAQGAMRLIFPGGEQVWFFVATDATADPNRKVMVNWATNAADRGKVAHTLREVADKLDAIQHETQKH
jgi:hypothetical protein